MNKTTQRSEYTIITPDRDIVADYVSLLKKELLNEFQLQGKSILIDLHGVNLIDSAGIGLLIILQKKFGSDFQITNISKDIESLLRSMCLYQNLNITYTPYGEFAKV